MMKRTIIPSDFVKRKEHFGQVHYFARFRLKLTNIDGQEVFDKLVNLSTGIAVVIRFKEPIMNLKKMEFLAVQEQKRKAT